MARIPDPVNLVSGARLLEDGRIDVAASAARPGERWTARVLIDAIVAITAVSPGEPDPADARGGRLRGLVRNDVRDLPSDLPTMPPSP